MRKFFCVPFLLLLIFAGCDLNKINTNGEVTMGKMTEAEAQEIAEKTCIKGGEALTSGGTYNPNSKTWWFDANLNSTQPGCNPACVVNEATKTAEINWRCTGLIEPIETVDGELPPMEIFTRLFAIKYPDQNDTISVEVTHVTADHARGSVSFADGMAGGNWLAAKTDGEWQIVYDGNGVIPCSLQTDYGFPEEMLSDCAE